MMHYDDDDDLKRFFHYLTKIILTYVKYSRA